MKFVVRERVPDMDYIAYCDKVPQIQGAIGRNFAEAIGNFIVEMANQKIGTVEIKIVPAKQGSAIKALAKKAKEGNES